METARVEQLPSRDFPQLVNYYVLSANTAYPSSTLGKLCTSSSGTCQRSVMMLDQTPVVSPGSSFPSHTGHFKSPRLIDDRDIGQVAETEYGNVYLCRRTANEGELTAANARQP